MRWTKPCLNVLLSGFLCSCARAAESEATPDEKPLDVKVRTIDAAGQPIAGALIEVRQSDRKAGTPRSRPVVVDLGKQIRTGADGCAAISMSVKKATSRALATYVCITAQAPGYLVTRNDPINTARGQQFEVLLTLRRLVMVEGRVVDQQGKPVAGATVFHTGNATPRTEATSDADGRFQLAGLVEGKSPIFVTHPAFHFHGQLLDTSAKSHELKLLGRDQTPDVLRTLPPLRSHEEELTLARQVIWPIVEVLPEPQTEGCLERCAPLEPWHAMDFVAKHLSQANKLRFVLRTMPFLYAAAPDEALSALESLDCSEYDKAFALINTVAQAPRLSPGQKLDLLDRAAQHARATTDPHGQVFQLSQAALLLFQLGKTEEAKAIVETLTPLAVQLPPKDSGACAAAGEAIGLFDLPTGLKLAESTRGDGNDPTCTRSLLRIAAQVADQQPAEAERIVTDALAAARASDEAYLKKRDDRETTEEHEAEVITYYENWLLPVCYRMAAADADRAERLARAIHDPHLCAYALGTVARALAPGDKPRAQKDIVAAFDLLTEASRNPETKRRPWPSWFCPPTVAGALLPVVEQTDPTLVRECLWRAVSYRLPRSPDEFLTAMEPENYDAFLGRFCGPL